MHGNLGVVFVSRDHVFWQIPSQFNKDTVRIKIQKDSSGWNIYPKMFFLDLRNTTVGAFRITSVWPSSKLQSMETRPDARSQSGGSKRILYAFPPSSTAQSSIRSNIKVLLITPAYHAQPWYPQLLGILISNLLLLPKKKNLPKDPLGKEYPLVEEKILRVMVWKIFLNSYICQEFHRWFSNLSQE